MQLYPSTGYLGLLVLFAAQGWVSAALWRAAGRRARGAALITARSAIVLFFAAVLACYCCTLSDLVARLDLRGPEFVVLGAAALIYTPTVLVFAVVASVGKRLRKHLDADVHPARRHALHLIGGAAIASPFAAIAWGSLVQRTNFGVREVDVPIPGLPEDLDGLRILQLSDIHLSPFLTEAEFARVVDASRELRPNLAVITGDLITDRHDPLDTCIRQLGRLRADAGIFGCMGNHERYAGVEGYVKARSARLGIEFLRGETRVLRFGKSVLNLAGVDYQVLAERRTYLRGDQRMIVPGACNVLLSHNPDVFPVAAAQGWNFVLAGHTHGGQVTVEILDHTITPIRFFTPYVYGLFRLGDSAEYVTRGIGTIGIPARLGAPPEISVLKLRKA